MTDQPKLYGLLAMFATADGVLEAARRARAAGYRHLDACTPFPVDGLAEAMGCKDRRLRWLVLLGGVIGAVIGYVMQWYSWVIDYPINIGGRPMHSWPAFLLTTFELAVLFAAAAGFFGMLALNGLPRLHHPLFGAKKFGLATRDRFFLCIESRDPQFDIERTRDFLRSLGPLEVTEVAQ